MSEHIDSCTCDMCEIVSLRQNLDEMISERTRLKVMLSKQYVVYYEQTTHLESIITQRDDKIDIMHDHLVALHHYLKTAPASEYSLDKVMGIVGYLITLNEI